MSGENQDRESSQLFTLLVMNFQSSAMMSMGKLINPVTQKIERNLDQAKFSIDLLGMLEEKTRGNLAEEEEQLLRKVLTELRLNYVDELEKDKKAAAAGGTAAGSQAGEEAGSPGGAKGRKPEESNETATGDRSPGSGRESDRAGEGREKKQGVQGMTSKEKKRRGKETKSRPK